MTLVVVGDPPTEIQAFIERRKSLGLDGSDEVWDGVHHMVPHAGMRHARVQRQLERLLEPLAEANGLYLTGEFNLGKPTDYRVPDFGIHRDETTDVYVASAVVVGEVISPNDETWAKFDFYAQSGVSEIVVADPLRKKIQAFSLGENGYTEGSGIACCKVTVSELHSRMTWP